MGGKKYGGRRARAFIFDLDGTLIDSATDIVQAANFARGHFDLPPVPVPVGAGYIGDGSPTLMRRMLGHDLRSGRTGAQGLPVSDEMAAEGLAIFADHYGRHCLDNTVAYPGVLDLLTRYRQFPLFVATNKPRSFTLQILGGLHLDGAFRRVVTGDDVANKKPHPEALEKCLAGLDIAPAEVAVIGDSSNDIEAARAFGAVAVGVTYGLTPAGLIRSAGPDHVINSISELADLFPSR